MSASNASSSSVPPKGGGGEDRSAASNAPLSVEEQQLQEIRRLLLRGAGATVSPFDVLNLDITVCEFSDVSKTFRRIALRVHPDKCKLDKAEEAFHIAEKAHNLLSTEAIFMRLKAAHERSRAIAEERRKQMGKAGLDNNNSNNRGNGSGNSTTQVPLASLSKEERLKRAREEDRVEQQLEAARLAEEVAAKKRRREEEESKRAQLAETLEKQRKEWKSMKFY